MTSLDPLKSVISIGNVDDTSLALPSAAQCRSGKQRVLEQVQTVKRTRSRLSRSRSASSSSSPTSPVCDLVSGDSSKAQSSTSNGSVFFGNGFSKTKRNTVASAYHYERSYGAVGSMAVGQHNSSRSEPDQAWQHPISRPVPPQRLLSNRSNYRPVSELITKNIYPLYLVNGISQTKANSKIITEMFKPEMIKPEMIKPEMIRTEKVKPEMVKHEAVKSEMVRAEMVKSEMVKSPSKPPFMNGLFKNKGDFGSNGNSGVVTGDITMKEAVECLSHDDEMHQHCGASYIQHNTFIDDKAKEEVLQLNGILPLVNLLRSPSLQVSQTASAALRNLSFKNDSNKEVINRCGGIAEAVNLLRNTNSVEIQKQLTGLLWNLSSAESLKPELLKTALPVLMEHVILPYTTGPDQTNRSCQDPEIFYHTTGCLRNVSSTKQSNRQAMRKCRGLIDSLVTYVKDCVEREKPDDKSVGNCVGILHNLTFQLEAEVPTLFHRITTLGKSLSRSHSQDTSNPISCFNSQNKSTENEKAFDYPVIEEPQPNGAGWLIHSQTLQSYLSLLDTSQQEETQEACCGALQNLTAHEGIVSNMMSQIIVQKLNGLQVITPLLNSSNANLQRSTVALVGNLTKNPNLQTAIARKALPELLVFLNTGTKEGIGSDDTLTMACQTANCLVIKEPEMGKHLLNNRLISLLKDLSQNQFFPKSSKAAAVFLYNLWSEKDLQSFLRKQGMSKSSFVNDITMAAHKSVQVVD
ncbi:plakophilin-1-like [Mastacembelus armatus]|uniref:Plakophilin 1b n=1 Tax=Mastacembelus armatus TaxID=205130 RepID=A0A3Q3LBN4_9TELE|nr:plakophilin-1-like [Mastacembelus armatus]